MTLHRALGLDPGSAAWRMCVLDDSRIVARESVETDSVREDPSIIGELVLKYGEGLEAIGAPSGHGLPTTTLDRVGPREIKLMTLKGPGESIVGLAEVIGILRGLQSETGISCFVLPAVRHLPSVPRYRKINRIDMGTSDKVCSAASVLQRLSEGTGCYQDHSFVLAEIGHSFSSFVCVRNGRIVDGIGGTMASYGPRVSGALDAELVHLWEFPDKASLYSGGLVDWAGIGLEELELGLAGELEGIPAEALERLAESVASDSLAVGARNGVDCLVLSSALGARTNAYLRDRIEAFGLELIEADGGEESASTGAAYLANGLANGRYRGLVESLGITEAKGSILEDIYLSGRPRIDT
jgi:predicted butyrate kinase (DUF1464 family)